MTRFKVFLVFACAVALALVLKSSNGPRNPDPVRPMPRNEAVLKAAPYFELSDFRGQKQELKGSDVVVLHFWAGWCPPCLGELPEWLEFAQNFQKKFPDKPVRWIAISLDKNWEDAHRILPESAVPQNVISLLDVEGRVADAYGSYQFPETYILNRSHQIAAKLVGSRKWSEEEGAAISAALEKLAL